MRLHRLVRHYLMLLITTLKPSSGFKIVTRVNVTHTFQIIHEDASMLQLLVDGNLA